MKLRTRLFLWVGIIFSLTYAVSIIFEVYSTDKNLQEAEGMVREKILTVQEKRRQRVEEFLHVSLVEDQAQIDALLIRIARDPNFAATLFLDPPNLKLEAPAHSAYLFKNDRWIDLIQTTKDNVLTSFLIPIDFPMRTAYHIPIDDDIYWVVQEKDRQLQYPLIGIRLPIVREVGKDLSYMIDELIETDWGFTVIFTPTALIDFKKKKLGEIEVGAGIDFSAFLKLVEKGAQYLQTLKQKDNTPGWMKKDIEAKSNGNIFRGQPLDRGIACLREEGEVLNNRIIELSQRGDQAMLISALASLFPTGEFGDTPFSPMAPKGIAQFPFKNPAGLIAFTDEVFFSKKLFDDAAYLKTHPGLDQCSGIGSAMAVIASQDLRRVFLGNSLILKKGSSQGYLTVAVDTDELMQDLVLTDHKAAFLVHNGQVVNAYANDGKEIPNLKDFPPFKKGMLKHKSGIIEWKRESYFYQHMAPFKNLDLHFFTLDLEKNAFALVNSVEEGSREAIKKVSSNMRIIAVIALGLVLLLLHNVAKRITKPITSLAQITKQVASGKLEDIELPKSPKGRKDEIATLCESFEQMITGLKEKEKVKGVLNKVVSSDIAQEIMKGQIHLGGEERKVTVLFADIRNFTGMTASKGPHEVIELLNGCMTKVSHVIDGFGGVIDKYVGDEVMALFGAPLEKEDSALKAIQSSLEIVRVLNEWNKERKEKGNIPVEMGIGIHTGIVLAGNMGAENRLNYTVLGSNVNIASRLCSQAMPMEILISKATLEEPKVKESIEVEELPPRELKGFEQTFVLYRVKGNKNV